MIYLNLIFMTNKNSKMIGMLKINIICTLVYNIYILDMHVKTTYKKKNSTCLRKIWLVQVPKIQKHDVKRLFPKLLFEEIMFKCKNIDSCNFKQ